METIIAVILVVVLMLFVVVLIYCFIVEYWPIILGVLAVALLVWIAVKATQKHLNEKAAAAWEKKEREIKQLRERNGIIRKQIEDYQEKVSALSGQIDTISSHNGEIEAFNDLFTAIGTSEGKVISNNQTTQIKKMQTQIDMYRKEIDKLTSELNRNQQRIDTN